MKTLDFFTGLVLAILIGGGLWLVGGRTPYNYVQSATPREAPIEAIAGAAEQAAAFKPLTLNGKLLKNKEGYLTERATVIGEMKKLKDGEMMSLDKLTWLQENWNKVVAKEACRVHGENLKFPEDYAKYLELSISAIERDNCL